MQSFNEWTQQRQLFVEGKKAKKAPKKKKEWKAGAKLGIKGTVKAALDHHPDKFSKTGEKGKLNPYAIFTAKAKKGMKPHYKNQKSTLKGAPKKKAEFKNEAKITRFSDWLANRVNEEHDPSKTVAKRALTTSNPYSGLVRMGHKEEKPQTAKAPKK